MKAMGLCTCWKYDYIKFIRINKLNNYKNKLIKSNLANCKSLTNSSISSTHKEQTRPVGQITDDQLPMMLMQPVQMYNRYVEWFRKKIERVVNKHYYNDLRHLIQSFPNTSDLYYFT